MNRPHLEFLVEEPSMEAFLRVLLPRLFPEITFAVHAFQGKPAMLRKLESRLRAYAHWLPDHYRIVVVIDQDSDDCLELKEKLEGMAKTSGLRTRSHTGHGGWQVVNRIVVEELEAWYFGDWEAVCQAYPRVSKNIVGQSRFRNPDEIRGGTWETFERLLKKHNYFRTGLRKEEAARVIGAHLDPQRNHSPSFRKFYEAVLEAVS